MTLSKSIASLWAGAAVLAATPATAQTQADQLPVDQQQADAGAATDTNAIIVTAQRRAENTLTVPVAVSVLRPDALHDFQASGADTLLSLSGRVPSLYVESTTGRIFPRFYIRGLGNIDFYLGASQPVSIIQDDVVEEHVVLKSNPAFDVAQVEVLKGPRGSLFGRNTPPASSSSTPPSRARRGRARARSATGASIASTPMSASAAR